MVSMYETVFFDHKECHGCFYLQDLFTNFQNRRKRWRSVKLFRNIIAEETKNRKYIYEFTTLNHNNSNLLQFFFFHFQHFFYKSTSVYERLQNGTVGKNFVGGNVNSKWVVKKKSTKILNFFLSLKHWREIISLLIIH